MKIDLKLVERERSILINIDNYLSESIAQQSPRTYLGGSVIGKECDRQLWYEYHSPIPNQDPRIQRIFHMGHLLESYVISLLKHSGYEVFHEDAASQFGFRDGKIAGNIDGVIIVDGKPLLLEIKSASDKRFNEMVKTGVEQSDPIYYTQMQVYMKYMELDEALFVAINKNNCELHMERIKFDKMHAEYKVNRGKEIVEMENEPERKYKTKAHFKCKMCSYKEKCWNGSDN
jgi:CRISPR/Cas system-associated exonuclease Cas4 (RecB family)